MYFAFQFSAAMKGICQASRHSRMLVSCKQILPTYSKEQKWKAQKGGQYSQTSNSVHGGSGIRWCHV